MLTAEDMRTVLVTASVGINGTVTSTQWRIFTNSEPEVRAGISYARAITLIVTDTPISNPKWALDTDTLQVLVRGEAGQEEEAQLKAVAVRNALLGLSSRTIDTTRYVGVWLMNGPSKLGYDDGNRAKFSLNFMVTRQPAALGNRSSL